MLTTPDNLLFFHLLVDDLQDKLLHLLSWDGGEADELFKAMSFSKLPPGFS